jgi:hypothetical protein
MHQVTGYELACIRCDESFAVDELGYCGHCHWVVKAEVVNGLSRFAEYLAKWAQFDEWCRGAR